MLPRLRASLNAHRAFLTTTLFKPPNKFEISAIRPIASVSLFQKRSFGSANANSSIQEWAKDVVSFSSTISPQCAVACRGMVEAYSNSNDIEGFWNWAKDDLDRFSQLLYVLQDHCGLSAILTMRNDVRALMRSDNSLQAAHQAIHSSLGQWVKPGLLHTEIVEYDPRDPLVNTIAEMDAILPNVPVTDQFCKDRFGPGRRCFALLHPALPRSMPLCFTNVALLPSIPTGYSDIYGQSTENNPTVATFYAITTPTSGLEGLSLGNILIVDAVNRLGVDVPSLKEFCTLSPIPGFKRYLESLDADKRPDESSQAAMMTTCANYLGKEKRGKGALDPVANFHLANGAEMGTLHWKADTGTTGLVPTTSYGMMLNYRYFPMKLEENHRNYQKYGEFQIHDGMSCHF